MTNSILPLSGAALSPELAALAPIGGKRRPVKVVQHPAFRAARARLDSPFTVVRVPVVSLNRQSAAAWGGCRSGSSTLAATQEAA